MNDEVLKISASCRRFHQGAACRSEVKGAVASETDLPEQPQGVVSGGYEERRITSFTVDPCPVGYAGHHLSRRHHQPERSEFTERALLACSLTS